MNPVFFATAVTVNYIMSNRNRAANIAEFVGEHNTKNTFVHGPNFSEIMPRYPVQVFRNSYRQIFLQVNYFCH